MKIVSLTHNGTYYEATVHVPAPPDGQDFHVDRKYGSWMVVIGDARCEVIPSVAAALQARVKQEERRAARAV